MLVPIGTMAEIDMVNHHLLLCRHRRPNTQQARRIKHDAALVLVAVAVPIVCFSAIVVIIVKATTDDSTTNNEARIVNRAVPSDLFTIYF